MRWISIGFLTFFVSTAWAVKSQEGGLSIESSEMNEGVVRLVSRALKISRARYSSFGEVKNSTERNGFDRDFFRDLIAAIISIFEFIRKVNEKKRCLRDPLPPCIPLCPVEPPWPFPLDPPVLPDWPVRPAPPEPPMDEEPECWAVSWPELVCLPDDMIVACLVACFVM